MEELYSLLCQQYTFDIQNPPKFNSDVHKKVLDLVSTGIQEIQISARAAANIAARLRSAFFCCSFLLVKQAACFGPQMQRMFQMKCLIFILLLRFAENIVVILHYSL